MAHTLPSTTARVSILGSTGSVGTQTLEVLREQPERFECAYLSTNRNISLLAEQIREFNPVGVAIADEQAYWEFRRATSFKGEILCGEEGVRQAAAYPNNDVLMSALVGFSGVLPTLDAIKAGTTIALANKETLVSAGAIITAAAREYNVALLPVDSEHSALQQCLVGESPTAVEKMILTASGGPFREFSTDEMQHVTREQALRHPNWDMGAKITIDSATLMNKGFEVIEAHWLFDLPPERIDVLVHPQSIIHSMVQFVDGSVKAQLGLPDMKLPILYALCYPERIATDYPRMNLAAIGNLSFFPPDFARFPCLRLAFDAMAAGGNAPAILNAANEVAVRKFLEEKAVFSDIPRLVDIALSKIDFCAHPSLDEILDADKETRSLISALAAS